MARVLALISLQTAVNELYIIYLYDLCERADESEDISEKFFSDTSNCDEIRYNFFFFYHLISFDHIVFSLPLSFLETLNAYDLSLNNLPCEKGKNLVT